ncbi:MAG: IS630 family transposase [Pyrinomonadaceae bacterium]|nr:IS630 family transposase [Pyrinomonadaceae bacterium]
MPNKTILEIPEDEQEQMRRELRHARYGYLLGLHILLLCAEGRTPTEIAAVLFCSRSSVYRAVEAYRQGKRAPSWTGDEQTAEHAPASKLRSWQRSLFCLLKQMPHAFGWCRTRWSCATLSLQLATQRGYGVSRETIRRTLHSFGYAWKRARHIARDADPDRVSKLARIRHLVETLPGNAALFFADELDINLLPKLGYEWMRKGTQKEVETPGKNEKNYLAGALNHVTGKLLHVVGEKKNRFLVIHLLEAIDRACPMTKFTKIYVVVDNYKIHKARAVVEWLTKHPRFELVWLPSYCPRANPIERAFLDVHDKCTRNHKRKRLRDLVGDVVWHLRVNGPWRYRLSEIYYTPEVDKAVTELKAVANLKAA